MKKYCWFNGKIIICEKISISPYDLGLLRGYGIIDVMRTQNNKPLLLKEHFQRFKNGADKLNLKIPFNKIKFEKIIYELLKNNKISNDKELTIKTILTGGISPDAISVKNPACYILIDDFKELPERFFKKGAKTITIEHKRYLPEVKTTNYIEMVKNQNIKNKNKALEIIYVKNGKALEASTSNLFIVKNNGLISPKNEVLPGITRNLIIKLVRKNKISVKEKDISENELKNADEVFLTATNKNIVPIVNIDGKKIGNGKPGKITKNLMKKLAEFLKNY